MINYNNFIKNAINIENNIEDLQPLAGKSVFVFPFKVVSGITNYTENGEKSWKYNPADFTSFFSVLNGKETVIAVWEDSTISYSDSLTEESPLNGLVGEYKVGRHIKGYLQSDTSGSSISNLNGLDGYTAIKTNHSYTISFGADAIDLTMDDIDNATYWNPQDIDLLKFYIIPEVFGTQWLKIDNINKLYDASGNIVRTEITFTSIGDALAKTAGVNVSLIQPSCSGEGYAWPKIENVEDGINETKKVIRLDTSRLITKPSTSIQLKCDGIAGIHTFIAFGRPVYKSDLEPVLDENGKYKKRISPPQMLLPLRTVGSYNDHLSWKSLPIDNFYVAGACSMNFKTYYKDWKEHIKVLYDPTATANYEGILECATTQEQRDEIKASNPLGGAKFRYNLKDDESMSLFDTNKVYETQATPACESSMFLYKDRTYTYAEILAHNYFISYPMNAMPQGSNSTTTWSLKDIPIVGGFLNTILSGANFGFQVNTTKIPTPNLPFILPADLFDMQISTQGGENFNWNLPLDFFRFGKSDQLGAVAGFGNFNTTLRVKLTHQYKDNQNIKNTLYLGQSKNPDGSVREMDIWNSNCKPVPVEIIENPVVGYIIDSVLHKTLYSGNYVLTLLGGATEFEPEPINDFKLITKSSMTNSIREWTNAYNLSFWKEGFNTESVVKWPEAFILPIKNQDIHSDVYVPNDSIIYTKQDSVYIPKENGEQYSAGVAKLLKQEGFSDTIWRPRYYYVDGDWARLRGLDAAQASVSKDSLFFLYYFDGVVHRNLETEFDLLKSINSVLPAQNKLADYAAFLSQFNSLKIKFSIHPHLNNSFLNNGAGDETMEIILSKSDLKNLLTAPVDINKNVNFGSGISQKVILILWGLVVPTAYNGGCSYFYSVDRISKKDDLFKINVKNLFRINTIDNPKVLFANEIWVGSDINVSFKIIEMVAKK